jgi:hypothetical protein
MESSTTIYDCIHDLRLHCPRGVHVCRSRLPAPPQVRPPDFTRLLIVQESLSPQYQLCATHNLAITAIAELLCAPSINKVVLEDKPDLQLSGLDSSAGDGRPYIPWS